MSIKYVEIGDSMYSETILYQVKVILWYQGKTNGDYKDYLNNASGLMFVPFRTDR